MQLYSKRKNRFQPHCGRFVCIVFDGGNERLEVHQNWPRRCGNGRVRLWNCIYRVYEANSAKPITIARARKTRMLVKCMNLDVCLCIYVYVCTTVCEMVMREENLAELYPRRVAVVTTHSRHFWRKISRVAACRLINIPVVSLVTKRRIKINPGLSRPLICGSIAVERRRNLWRLVIRFVIRPEMDLLGATEARQLSRFMSRIKQATRARIFTLSIWFGLWKGLFTHRVTGYSILNEPSALASGENNWSIIYSLHYDYAELYVTKGSCNSLYNRDRYLYNFRLHYTS